MVAIGQNFTASTLGTDSSSVPPDSNGAAGPLHFVEFVNGRFAVFDKSNGSRVKSMTDTAFWTQAGLTLPSGWDVTDPRIVYDPTVQRWFASQVDFEPTGVINTNHFLLAVSATPNPTGIWKAVSISGDPAGDDFADFPTLGLDAQAVYLSGDMFDPNSFPVGPTLVSIPKADLLADPPVTSGLTRFGVMRYQDRGDILQPAICVDGSGQGEILAAASVGIGVNGDFVTNKSLVSFQVQNAANSGGATLSSSDFLSVPPYTAPLNPTQPDGSDTLDDGDARLSANVYEVHGVLYAVQGTQLNNQAVLRWYRIDAATHTVLESGTISDPVNDLFYPSIAANAAGTVVVAFNGASISTFVSSFAVVGKTENGITTFGSPLLLKAGVASYENTGSDNTSRWGDYSATCVDPADSNRFWTIQEFPSSASRWSTQVTELVTGLPSLAFAVSANDLELSWTATSFTLETADNLATPNWTAVTKNLSTNSGVVSVAVPMTSIQGFFRLHQP